MLRQRILTAAVLLPLALGALFLLPNALWSVVIAIVMALGGWEWGRLSGWGTRGRIAFACFIAASCLAVYMTLASGLSGAAKQRVELVLLIGAMVFWLGVAVPWFGLRWHVRAPLPLALAGWWVLVPAGFAAARLQHTPALLLALLIVIWVADTAAYFAGRRFGRNKLAPHVSPGKTWEGVAGAFLGVLLYFMALAAARLPVLPTLMHWPVVAVFFAMTALGIVGDLFESWMKREAGVKDSGTLLPGHGGVLDRIDALTASLPLAALAAVTVMTP
ncbi:MAG: phosphatidate cytidylyltransferase [Betaproteobacteria bacterium]